MLCRHKTSRYLGCLGAGLVLLTALACSPKRPSPGQCERALTRYWGSRDIDPYFSRLSFSDAVRRCREHASRKTVECVASGGSPAACSGVEGLPVDDGWRSGFHCLHAEDDGRGRCERSNRECDHYRRVHARRGRKLGRCEPAKQAWVLEVGSEIHNPVPDRSDCQELRTELLTASRIDAGAACMLVSYSELVASKPRERIAPPASE